MLLRQGTLRPLQRRLRRITVCGHSADHSIPVLSFPFSSCPFHVALLIQPTHFQPYTSPFQSTCQSDYFTHAAAASLAALLLPALHVILLSHSTLYIHTPTNVSNPLLLGSVTIFLLPPSMQTKKCFLTKTNSKTVFPYNSQFPLCQADL